MSFSADWLALRAAADSAARDVALVSDLRARLGGRAVSVLDLGAGSGATLAALHASLPAARWRLTDHDPALLALAQGRAASLGATAQTLALDLACDLAAAFSPAPALVTASAFIDLVGPAWLEALCDAAAQARAAVYIALSYDGRETWAPPHPDDDAVHAAFMADMGRDKGLGPALGARAGAALAEGLRARGYAVRVADSPWRLSAPRDAKLIAALAEGKAAATGAGSGWLASRRSAASALIGHVDVLGWPPD